MTSSATRPAPITEPPDRAEMQRRLDRVRTRMESAAVDAYVVHDPDNVFYLTNFANYVHERPFVLVVPIDGPLRFVAPQLEAAHVRVRSVGDIELIPYVEFPAPAGDTWADRVRDALAGAERVGVESSCPLQVADELPGTRVRVDVVDDARMIKTDYEIGRLAHASQLVGAAHAEVMGKVAPGDMMAVLAGDTTRDLTLRMLGDMPNANMLASSFGAVIQPPSISHDPHNFTDLFIAMEQGGPHVSVINSVVNGYGAEIERTFFLNTVPDEAHRPFEAMMEARRTAFDLTVPDATRSDVDQAVRDVLERHGYLDAILHRTGHSFGVTGHEAPFLAVSYDHEIRPGMLFSIEPGIYLDGIGGFRHSDTVLVTEDGNVSLTTAPDQLDDLILDR